MSAAAFAQILARTIGAKAEQAAAEREPGPELHRIPNLTWKALFGERPQEYEWREDSLTLGTCQEGDSFTVKPL